MPSLLSRLKAAHCRIDGLLVAPDGTPSFAATLASGEWSTAQQAAIRDVLGLSPPVMAPTRRIPVRVRTTGRASKKNNPAPLAPATLAHEAAGS